VCQWGDAYADGTLRCRRSPKFLHTQPRVPENGAQRSSRYFTVIWHHDSAVRRSRVAKHDMAAALPIHLVSGFLQNSNDAAARDHRQPRHYSSTISSVMGGGIGSPCSCRLSM